MEVHGYPNYFIYPDGRLYSQKRNGFNGGFLKGEIVKGYHRVNLVRNKISTHFQLHRLVADHYIPNTENKACVDHKDRDRLNNDVSNLRWVSHCENQHNKGKNSRNKSGYKNIMYQKCRDYWKYHKIFRSRKENSYQIQKYYKTLKDALCYKFIIILRIKARHFKRFY